MATKKSSRSPVLGIIITLTLALLVVTIFAYFGLQQSYRQSANDPQIQIADDLAARLSSGSQAKDLVSESSIVDPSKSLATFTTVVDAQGKVRASNAKLQDQPLVPPKGVLNAASVMQQNRITWQPQSGLRIALIVQGYKHNDHEGYVLVGRSLAEVDKRTNMLFWMMATTVAIVAALGLFAAAVYSRK